MTKNKQEEDGLYFTKDKFFAVILIFAILLLVYFLTKNSIYLGNPVAKSSTSTITLPSISPTLTTAPTLTDTPTPIPLQQAKYFVGPLYCPKVYLSGVTPCVDQYKTPVACVSMLHPDGSPIINLICGIPNNSNSVKSCINYMNNPNVVICPQ